MEKTDAAVDFKTEESAGASMEHLRAWVKAAEEAQEKLLLQQSKGSSAVLVPVILREDGYHVLYEVRAAKLNTQPGEICFPGGRIEPGEDPGETAVREVMEELLIDRDQIEIVTELKRNAGPGGVSLYSFLGVLHDYEGTWSKAEVEYVFTLPLQWILENDPVIYRIELKRMIPEDFPFDKVPYGRDYHWRREFNQIPFYPDLRYVSGECSGTEAEKGSGDEEAAEKKGTAGQGKEHPERGCFSEKAEERGMPGGPAEAVGAGQSLPDEMPVLWGATARVTYAVAQYLRLAGN